MIIFHAIISACAFANRKEPPLSRGLSRFAGPRGPRPIPAAKPGSLSQPPGILAPGVNSLSGYFFLVFLAGFFFAILLFIIGLDLVAFLVAFFITGIGTSCLPGLLLDKHPF